MPAQHPQLPDLFSASDGPPLKLRPSRDGETGTRAGFAAPAVDDGMIRRIAQLAQRGNYEEAAVQAADCLEDGERDIRLVGYYCFGLCLERGLAALPAIFSALARMLKEQFAQLGPEKKKSRVTDATLVWLFQTMDVRLRYHRERIKAGDDVWRSWLEGAHIGLAQELAQCGDALADAVSQVLSTPDGEPQCITALHRLLPWLLRELDSPLSQQRLRAGSDAHTDADDYAPTTTGDAPEHIDKTDDVDSAAATDMAAAEAEAFQDAHVPGADRPTETAGVPDWADSPAMRMLQKKLRGFAQLLERGEHEKAAMVAMDVRQIIEEFDPVLYLPHLFAGYFQYLHRHIEVVMPYWDMSGGPAWDALHKYYRADLDGFLSE